MSASLPPTVAPTQLECPKCKAPITYFDVKNSSFYVCPHCRTFFEAQGLLPPRIINGFKKSLKSRLPLLVGTTGRLFGDEYRVVGAMVKKETRNSAQWVEYMLLQQTTGTTAQLAVYEGHWMFIQPTDKQYTVTTPSRAGQHIYVDTVLGTYQIYNRYSPRVLYAIGEFDWNILDDEKLVITEFILPPFMLVQEQQKSSDRVNWYKGEHLEPAQIEAAFQVDPSRIPRRNGVGAIQPAPGEGNWPALKWVALVMALAVVVTQLLLLFVKPERLLLQQQFSSQPATMDNAVAATAAGSNNVIVTRSFEVQGPAALEFDLKSSLSNQWVEVPITLVNENTGVSYEFTKSLEYYSGVEDGESWSEGSRQDDATLAGIPSGHYHLNLYPTSDFGTSLLVDLTVSQNTPLHSNAVLALLVLLLYPGIQFFRRHNFEQTRWLNSDYGP